MSPRPSTSSPPQLLEEKAEVEKMMEELKANTDDDGKVDAPLAHYHSAHSPTQRTPLT